MELAQSDQGVVDIKTYRGSSPKWLLIEVPHGATRKSDYDAVVGFLQSSLPDRLEHFFFVNTDVGAPEAAEWLARSLSAGGINVAVARCLIPRTFIDTNRFVDLNTKGVVHEGLTPAVPGYVDAPADVQRLTGLHARYHRSVESLYRAICGGAGGLALQLHSYAPRSVEIEKTDAGIVAALHAAYQPDVYSKWRERPAVDLISATADGSFRAAPALVAALRAAFAAAGIAAGENATYHLHPITMALEYARRYPDQVICVELNRELLADPFVPFGVSPISEEKVAKMAAPLAQVLAAALK